MLITWVIPAVMRARYPSLWEQINVLDREKGGVGKHRTASEYLFIPVHNGLVALLSAVAWLVGSTKLALYVFCLEVAYEVFDSIWLGPKRLEPETVIHHLVSPICILCSTQTEVDFRVLCHLAICIDLSGAILGFCKFLLRYTHIPAAKIYQRLTYVYVVFRVVLPLIDTMIIVAGELTKRPVSDWLQLYFWSMAVMDTFNCYFCWVLWHRAKAPNHILNQVEGRCEARHGNP
eukprot:gnl/MRDRNA2_/MRDRNA2_181694_c0_seq1.p1 gnl/MRDRNA2_/MRDRNA2_181694_c0~~gnl/MRDRNA2_/MRDRNA2_181694_c0_seq1.p1  ORF type:complete len:251 (+),score=25.29 gnl/MRDRNA2_/MRDRNA2_181694_c0_seq1:57-755(+)